MNAQTSVPPSGPAPGVPSGAPAGPSGGRTPPGEEFFAHVRSLGVVRPDERRWAAGVCAGLARRWGVDPLLVRGIFVAVGLVGGVGLGVYGLLWLFLPHPDGRIHAQEVLRGHVSAGFVGATIAVFVDLPITSWGNRSNGFGGLAWVVVLGVGVWWWTTRSPRRGRRTPDGPGTPEYGTPPPSSPPPGAGLESETSVTGAPSYPEPSYPEPSYPEPSYPAATYPAATYPAPSYPAPSYPEPSYPGHLTADYGPVVTTAPVRVDATRSSRLLTRTTVGAAAVAAATIGLWGRFVGGFDPPTGLVASAVALGIIALGIVAAGLSGRRAGLLTPLGIVLALVTAGGTAGWSAAPAELDARRSWAPVATAPSSYSLGSGRAVLDLSSPQLVAAATASTPVRLDVSVGAGELVVIVPKDTPTEIDAHVGLGGVQDDLSDSTTGGPGVDRTVFSGSSPRLVVDAHVGLGQIRIVPQGTEVTR